MVDVPGYVGRYAVTDSGKVWSHISNKFLTPGGNGTGYLQVNLWKDDGTNRLATVHRLVLETFHGPANGRQANHKDGDKHNNALSNLEWVSPSANSKHRATVLGKVPSSGADSVLAGTYLVTLPSGAKVTVTGLRKFCRDNGLDCPTMIAVSKGRHATHKGYACVKIQ